MIAVFWSGPACETRIPHKTALNRLTFTQRVLVLTQFICQKVVAFLDLLGQWNADLYAMGINGRIKGRTDLAQVKRILTKVLDIEGGSQTCDDPHNTGSCRRFNRLSHELTKYNHISRLCSL